MSNLEVRFSHLQTNCRGNRKKVALDLWNSNRMSIYARTCTYAQLLANISGLLICIPGIDQDEWRLGTYHGRYAANSRCGTGVAYLLPSLMREIYSSSLAFVGCPLEESIIVRQLEPHVDSLMAHAIVSIPNILVALSSNRHDLVTLNEISSE